MSSLEWMAWTTGTAVFVCCLALSFVCLVGLSILWPSSPHKGWLPIETARGDRIYISLLGTGLAMILFVSVTDAPLPVGLAIAIVAWVIPVMRWG